MKVKRKSLIAKKQANAKTKLKDAETTIDSFPLAARSALQDETQKAQVMLDALNRDLDELDSAKGADAETVEKLADHVELKVEKIEREKEFLGLGKPTTLVTTRQILHRQFAASLDLFLYFFGTKP